MQRPRIPITLTPANKVVEAISWVLLAGLWAFSIFCLVKMPHTIPVHYNFSGKVDRFGSKWTLIILPVLATFLLGFLTVLNRYPHQFNYLTELTPDNAQREYSRATRLLRYLKLSIVLICFGIVLEMYLFTVGMGAQLGIWSMPLYLGLVFIPIIIYLVRGSRK